METTRTSRDNPSPTIKVTKAPNRILAVKDHKIETIVDKIIDMSNPTISQIRVLLLKTSKETTTKEAETILANNLI